jgi:SP family facilitated glucose transporter-like MFS transporter 8
VSWAASARGAMASNMASGGEYKNGSDHDDVLQKPLLPMVSPQSSLNTIDTFSIAVLRESHVFAFLYTLIVMLDPFNFTSGCSSPMQASIRILATCAALIP